jgi:hypothetical protein
MVFNGIGLDLDPELDSVAAPALPSKSASSSGARSAT